MLTRPACGTRVLCGNHVIEISFGTWKLGGLANSVRTALEGVQDATNEFSKSKYSTEKHMIKLV